MQVQVGDVRPELPRPGQADQRVEIGAVDVDLPAGLVHQLADPDDRLLVHAVRGRVGHHDRGKLLAVLLDLRDEVVDVHVALVVTGDHGHAHARHHGARGVGAVGGRGDQADVAARLAARGVVGADRQEPGELAWEPAFGWSDTAS
ncbi:hypothetical protein GCM10018952_64670 [Streptosporangium vulgare]